MELGSKILIVGANGSGKTTFGKKLAHQLNLPFYELDSISWLEDWGEMPHEEFIDNVYKIAQTDSWIIDGNYSRSISTRFSLANTAIWLDYPLPKIIYRVTKRTLVNFISRRVLWKNNKQSFRKVFHPKESIIVYSIRTYNKKKNTLTKIYKENNYKNLLWVHIRNYRDEKNFWKSLK